MNEGAYLMDKIRSRCVEEGDCWLWQGAKNNQGPIMSVDGKMVAVRIVSWQAAKGMTFPAGRRANLKCRNRLCVNPEHVVPLTMSEQMRVTQRNRSVAQRYASQVAAHRTRGLKVTDEAVHEIRYGGATVAEMIEKHSVSRTYVYAVRRGVVRREHASPFVGLIPMGGGR